MEKIIDYINCIGISKNSKGFVIPKKWDLVKGKRYKITIEELE